MNINTYKSCLPIFFKSKVTCLVWGVHGIGKSTAPEQFAAENGHKLINLRLGNLEAGDLIGLQDFTVDQYAGTKTATKHFMPDWLHELTAFCRANPDKYGILHLDEINHIRRDLQSFVWQICLDRRLHTYVFPENLTVIASANPPTKDYPGTLDFKNKALLSRFCHIALRPELSESLSYYRGQNYGTLADFLQDRPQMLQGSLETFSTDEYCKPSPRSWEAAVRLLNAGAPLECLYGMVGVTAAESYINFTKEQKEVPVNADDILNSYSKVGKKIKKLIKEEKYAELKLICESVQTVVLEASKQNTNNEIVFQYAAEIGKNVAAFAKDLPADLSMAFLLVVSGPSATALMDILDADEEMHTFVKEMVDTGKFKIAQ